MWKRQCQRKEAGEEAVSKSGDAEKAVSMRGGCGKGSFKKGSMRKRQCLRGEDEEETVSMRGGRGKGSFKKGRIRKRQCENLSVPHCHCSLPVCIHAGFIFHFMGTVKKEGKKGIKKRNQNTVQNRCG